MLRIGLLIMVFLVFTLRVVVRLISRFIALLYLGLLMRVFLVVLHDNRFL